MANEVIEKGRRAKKASILMNMKTTDEKNKALAAISRQLQMDAENIIKANRLDLQQGADIGLSTAVLDRIMLNETRIQAMCEAIQLLARLPDPVGETLENIEKENGLQIVKKRVPLGVIGMIYEARPNVTIDAATLALKTGNAILLRGSSSAKHSNIALVASIHTALAQVNFPLDAVLLIEDTSRETAKSLFHLNEFLDVLIPRGGKDLIDTVVREASVPVLETGAGNCHIFIDDTAPFKIVCDIIQNAKTQRPSVCNAVESLVVHRQFLQQYGSEFFAFLRELSITIYGDEVVCELCEQAIPASETHYAEEFLALSLSIKTVDSVTQAIEHIQRYSTKHSEAIITMTQAHADLFLTMIDAAAVYHNASTRFTDGFEFGYGAEVGISTQKLHARGPMGLPALTSTKYYIYGNGQIRS
ncbi:glutamate-5-semialdehyde dehydrogenase [Metasolibacillus sp.]|uniref:glutamate-5-semialdehyde dehydrogenase n=1 Tax=Metasolibacillus sp. TaxID=2703680 RepID=UPI0025E51191|nr:glutamate-5-semialdehyde dehydrogenase [Metasolibacillus sp.]MCT6922759.1 glutamate-5-semialdehyde dehydrogenase [Metasolibacillus sp.]MCT6938902.1 glutamate-5-semialdehyde dehydrogenase [Metasolibacillus sp.]